MPKRYLELGGVEREALRGFAVGTAAERDSIVGDVLAELGDVEELSTLFEGGTLDDRVALAVGEYVDELGQDPDGAYLERRVASIRDRASDEIPYAAFVVSFMVLERVLLKWNRLHTCEASIDTVRDALLRLNDIHVSATATAYLAGKEDIIRAQQEAMLTLSAPVVEIWEGILALPLVGTIDTARARHITQNLLQTLRDTQARVVIMDISGVPLVDTSVANHLMKTAAAARLLGAHGIIVGISPEIASTLVSLDIDFDGIETYYSMRQGLQAALARLGAGSGQGNGTPSAGDYGLSSFASETQRSADHR